MKLPKEITNFINNRGQNTHSVEACLKCDSNCCTGPGFALYENVVEIYKKYANGQLIRDDYNFESNLALEDFIFKYFDKVAFQNGSLITFFPKTLSDDGLLISVPPWNYYESRDYLQRRYGKRGCIFLKNKFEIDNIENECLLHNKRQSNEISEKPIDCVFLKCNSQKKLIKPTSTESTLWFSLLDYYFPDSCKKFNTNHPKAKN